MPVGSSGKPVGSQNLPLQQEGAPNYALLVNVAGGAAMNVNVTDRAARLLGIVYGDLGQLLQLVPADALAPGNSLEVAGFNFVYNGATWDMVREGNTPGSMMVEDTGLNTNPRRYEKDNGFYSAPTTRAGGVATAMWTTATTPARTAGEETTIYSFHIENSTGGAVTAWLEVGGVAVTIPYAVVDADSVTISWPAGLDIGNQDINLNASANDVIGQISGTEA